MKNHITNFKNKIASSAICRRGRTNKQKGALLLELLIVISLLAIILSFGVNAMFLSLKSNKVAGERDIATALANESLEAVRATSDENWQNIYGLSRSPTHYYPKQSLGKWVLTTVPADGTVTVNNVVFTRYVVVENVSRDPNTHIVQTTYSSGYDDPSTQKVTSTVSWTGADPIVVFEYFFRWKNKLCPQTSWTTAIPGNTVTTNANCPTSATYDSKDATVDTSTGSLKLQ